MAEISASFTTQGDKLASGTEVEFCITVNPDELNALLWGLKMVMYEHEHAAAGWMTERLVSSHHGECETGVSLGEYWATEGRKNRGFTPTLIEQIERMKERTRTI